MGFKSFGEYLTEETKEVTFGWGRYNPPTNGHEKLFDTIKKVARGGQFRIYASKSNDPKKNPLNFKTKIKFLRKMFPKYARNIMGDNDIRTIFDIVVKLYDQGFTKATLVAGSDRVTEFETLLNKYNNVEGRHGFYNFEGGIRVVSAGDRDPDSDDVSGMSASKLRAAAYANDLESFSKGMPKGFTGTQDLFNAIRTGMGLKESYNHRKHIQLAPASKEREAYIEGKLFIESDIVKIKESGDTGEVIMCGTNHVLVEFADGTLKKYWLDAVEKVNEYLEEDCGAGEEGTNKLVNKYKKETPGEQATTLRMSFRDVVEADDVKKSLMDKSDKSGISYSILKQVFDRGYGAWKTGHRPGTNPTQWAHARVNSFMSGGKTRTTADADLWAKHNGKSESVQEKKSETWEDGFKRRVVKVTDAEQLDNGNKWRIKGKERDEVTIKYYKDKPDFEEFTKQMKRVAGHEFGG